MPPAPAEVAVFQSTVAALGSVEAGAEVADDDAGADVAGADVAGADDAAPPPQAATTTVIAARALSTRDFISMCRLSSRAERVGR
jgi:hypothetical protein